VSTAVVLATAPGPDPARPAAALRWEDGTVLERLLDQLAALGVADLRVLVRPAHRAAVEPLTGGRARLHVSEDAAADLRAVAAIARDGAGGLVVALGDVVTQREALAGLLADPRVATGVLSSAGRIARPFGQRLRNRRGRVIAAASPFHVVHQPNATFLGVLKVAAPDRGHLAAVAGELAGLRADPPAAWRTQLDIVQPGVWKLALDRIARNRAAREAAGLGAEHDDEAEAERDALEAEAAAELDPAGAGADEEARERRHPDDVELSEGDAAELRRRVAAAPDDVASLLLVGLVRSGAQVGISHLRSLFWARPLSEDAIAAARERIAHHDEDAALLKSAVKASDGFFTTFFVSPYSRYIARWCAHRGLNPNQVTTFSMLLGLLAAAGFATAERWGMVAGALLLQLAFTFDCVDGQLARYTRTFTKLGAWLDSIFDRSKEYAVFAGLAIGAAHAGDPVWVLACAALGLQTARHFVDFSYPAAQHQAIGAEQQRPVAEPSDEPGKDLPRWLREPQPEPAGAAPAPRPPLSPARRALRLWRRIGRNRRVRWAKKVMAFPIGERFAAISLTAAFFDAKVTFIVLLAWGGLAGAYIVAGRVLRSLRSAAFVAPAGTGPGRLEAYRDDGPLARLAAGDRVLRGRLRWMVPPALRVVEFGGITALAAAAGDDRLPAAFALLCAIAFRHYDNVYRLRQRGEVAGDLVSRLGLGWDGRLLLVAVLVVAGATPLGLWIAAGALGLLFVGEAVHGWLTFNRDRAVTTYEDEEEEAE
jgi:phosphatidylglycerophosphate synthase